MLLAALVPAARPATAVPRHVQVGQRRMLVFEDPTAGAQDAYGSRLWPAASFLSERLGAEGDLAGLTVLELGCGNGLCSLTAAALGAESVIATDHVPHPLTLVERAAAAQPPSGGGSVTTRVLDFAAPLPGAAVVAARSRARRILPAAQPLPAHDVLLAAD
eukprot:5241616-Prymnesium_polylepis.1